MGIERLLMNSDHHTKTILAVDEESIVRSVLNATLSRAGYRVLDATSCKEAVRLSMGFPESIELLVTDVELKDGTGEELASQVLAIRPDVRSNANETSDLTMLVTLWMIAVSR